MNKEARSQTARQIVRAIQGKALNFSDPATRQEIQDWEIHLTYQDECSTPEKRVRILRVIEYIGTPEFVDNCIMRRGLKGTKIIPHQGYMREAILGDTAEVIKEGKEGELSVCRPKIT